MKKRMNNKRINRFIILMLCTVFTVSTLTVTSYADSKLDQAKEGLSSVQEKIKDFTERLQSGVQQENDINNQIEALDVEINTAEQEIKTLGEGIEQKKNEILEAQDRLDVIQGELDEQNENLSLRLRTMYKSGETSILQILLGSSDFSDFMTNVDMVQKIYDSDIDVLEEIQNRYDEVENQKLELERLKGELEEQKNDYKIKQDELQVRKQQADEIRSEIMNSNDELENQIDSLNKEANDLSATIRSLQSTGTTYSGGQMQWPVPSSTRITSKFGYRVHPILNTKKLHTGLDIGCVTGSLVVAANDGKVILSKYNGGYGYCVMIDHGGGIVTLYGHNSSLLVKVGDVVTRGQTIALSGSTGQSTGPHCHFEVRVNGSYVDPSPYVGL